MTDIRHWLEQHELSKYADLLAENEIDVSILPRLSEDDLKELGLPLGARRKLQAAIEQISESTPEPDSTSSRSSAVRSGEAERRQLTVMFCDLVGSTALSGSMDPEEYREILGAYQSAVRKAIERYDGFIARYMGDGLLVYFGYPQAHEEDPERAARAGLDIVDGVKALNVPGDIELQVRIGIATGLVVAGDIVGEGAAEERVVLGDTPNLAARLQAVAPPNNVLIAESTQRLVEGRFDLEPEGPRIFKGISGPVQINRVTGIRPTTRFEAASTRGVAPLLGRDEELGMLLRRWELANAGEGQVVLLGGEPGIGKSRLAEAMRERACADQHVLLRYQCSPYHVNSTFYPVIVQIERAAGIERGDGVEEKLDKLEKLLGGVVDEPWLVAALLSLPTNRYRTIELTPEKRKAEAVSILVEHLKSLARTSSVLVILEDAHWIDHSTRELFDTLTDEVARMRVLVVVTHRPEFESKWAEKGHATQLMLNRLGRRDVGSLVRSLTSDGALSEEVVQQILEKTDGIPLFVEELTKAVLESDLIGEQYDKSLEIEIPSTLQDSLVARLDRLGEAKKVAQLGATIGREFLYSLVVTVWENGEDTLRGSLEQLEESGLLHRSGIAPDASYTFKHALVRDAAYATLLRERRRELHRRVAIAMKKYQPAVIQIQPELLAHHLTEAGETDAALQQWLLAGQRAFSRSAALEAQAHLEKGRGLIAPYSDDGEHLQRELEFYVALGPVYMTTKGAHAEETEQVYQKARELGEKSPDRKTLFKAVWGQWHVKQVSGALDLAIPLAEECLNLSKQIRDEGCELQAHHAGWSTQFFRGEFKTCLEHADRGWDLYDHERHADHRFAFGGHDPGACGRYFGGLSHWFLGRPDKGATCAAQALELARCIDHPFSSVVTLLYTAYVAYFRRDHRRVRALAQEGVDICEELGFPSWLPGLAQLCDWALVIEEADADALARMDERISPRVVAGQLLPGNVMFLVDACVRLGRQEQGIAAISKGLKLAETLGQRWSLAEFYRLHGVLLMLDQSEYVNEAESKLRLSVELARKQQAKSIELRATTALARMRSQVGDTEDARSLLTPVYRAFNEGFDTRDLEEAKTLLNAL